MGRKLLMFRSFQLVRGSGRGRSVHSCSRKFPRRYGVILGPQGVGQARQMCGTNRQWGRILMLFRRFQLVRGRGHVWDKPTLGPDTTAVSPFPADPRERVRSELPDTCPFRHTIRTSLQKHSLGGRMRSKVANMPLPPSPPTPRPPPRPLPPLPPLPPEFLGPAGREFEGGCDTLLCAL